jgi:GAF domain-containing protein
VRHTKLDFTSSTGRTSLFGGLAVALAGPAVISSLAYVTNLEGKPGPAALFVIAVLVASILGGFVAGVIASFASFLSLSYFFIAPTHGFTFDGETVFALVSFLLAALLVAAVLDRERRTLDRLRASSATLEEARQRIGRLQAVTEALSEAATRADVANVLVREGLVALRAQAGAVFQLVSAGSKFESIASTGYPEELHAKWGQFDATAEGPASQAIRTGDLIVTESAADLVARWPRLAAAQRATGDEATITAPLIVGDDRIGVMHIAFRTPRVFQTEDLAFAQTLARQCAQALERARLYEEELHAREQAERLAGRLRRLQTVVDATFASGSLDELLEKLLARLRDAVESDTAAILILDETEQMLVTRESIGFGDSEASRVPFGEGFAGQIAATQRQLIVPDTSEITTVGAQLQSSGVVSLAGVPLVADGRTIGVVHVGMRTPREFDREDVLLLRLVAARAAVAIGAAVIMWRHC